MSRSIPTGPFDHLAKNAARTGMAAVIVAAVALVSLVQAVFAAPNVADLVAAQDGDGATVRGAVCTDAACDAYASFLAPFTVDAVNETTGDVLGRCTVAAEEAEVGCRIGFDTGVPHVFVVNDADVPAGYRYFGARIVDVDSQGAEIITFAFVPDSPLETERIQVRVGLCDDASCTSFADILPNTTVVVRLSDGATFDTCVTADATQTTSCAVDVPTTGEWDFGWVPAEIPDGYVYVGAPILPIEGPGPPVYTIGFYPEASDEAGFVLVVRAGLCTDDTCTEFSQYLNQFEINAVDVFSDKVVASCTTVVASQVQGCPLEFAADSTYTLQWDDAQVPDGYTPFAYPLESPDGGPGPRVTTLGFVPDGDADGSDATTAIDPDAHPAALIVGACDALDALGPVAADLSGIAVATGETVGAADAIAIESGYTALGIPMEELLAVDHVLIVYATPEHIDTGEGAIVACGAVGGPVSADGSIVFGLAAVGESGVSGVAYLAPGETDGETEVTVFLTDAKDDDA